MVQEKLHGRQRQLLALLRARQGVVTSKELAAQIEVSDRTVRTDVRILNEVLKHYGACIEVIRGRGLQLKTAGDNPDLINSLLYSADALQTREERANELLVRLLLSDTGEQLGDLEDEMFVSHTTLESDIQYVRQLITDRRPQLTLSRGRNRISINAPEWRKRLMLTKIYAERWDYHTREGLLLGNTPLDPELFRKIEALIKKTAREHRVKLDDYDLIALTFTLAIAQFRIRTGHPLEEQVEPLEQLTPNPAITQLIDDVERITHTPFSQEERRSIQLSASFRVSPIQEPENPQALLDSLDPKSKACTELYLQRLKDDYGVDFSGDPLLFADLARHIYRLEKRLRFSYERKNAILSTLKTRYIYFFELAIPIRDCFRQIYGLSIGEDEWGYLADCLITAVDRAARQHYPRGIPTAFVSHLGRSDREMLMSEIRSIYGNTLDLRGPFSIYQKSIIRESRPELILSTVRLETVRPELVHIPHMTIYTAIDDDVFIRLNLHIKEVQERLFFTPLPQDPGAYFDPDLFFTDLDLHSEEEVITFLTEQLVKRGCASAECTAQTLDREACSATSMETGIAIPRLRGDSVTRTVIAVARLRRSIHWNGQKVSTVFLLSVRAEDSPLYGTLLQYLANHLCRRRHLKRLHQLQSFEELAELL